jgi:hypothetical protein
MRPPQSAFRTGQASTEEAQPNFSSGILEMLTHTLVYCISASHLPHTPRHVGPHKLLVLRNLSVAGMK